MADICERGSDRAEELTGDALAVQARRSGLEGKTVDDSATQCCFCEDTIPEERRQAYPGVQTCVDCQEMIEQAEKRKGMA